MGKKQTNYPAASKTFSGCTECSSLHRQWAEFFKSIGHCALYNGFLSPSHRGNRRLVLLKLQKDRPWFFIEPGAVFIRKKDDGVKN
jgi:hypothetical protein